VTKLEIFGYSTLAIVLVIIAILIYLYINRFEVEEIIKENEYESESEKAIYPKNDEFDWEVYASELKFDDEKFLGYYFWKNDLSAKTRILEIKKVYSENPNIILFIKSYLTNKADQSHFKAF